MGATEIHRVFAEYFVEMIDGAEQPAMRFLGFLFEQIRRVQPEIEQVHEMDANPERRAFAVRRGSFLP